MALPLPLGGAGPEHPRRRTRRSTALGRLHDRRTRATPRRTASRGEETGGEDEGEPGACEDDEDRDEARSEARDESTEKRRPLTAEGREEEARHSPEEHRLEHHESKQPAPDPPHHDVTATSDKERGSDEAQSSSNERRHERGSEPVQPPEIRSVLHRERDLDRPGPERSCGLRRDRLQPSAERSGHTRGVELHRTLRLTDSATVKLEESVSERSDEAGVLDSGLRSSTDLRLRDPGTSRLRERHRTSVDEAVDDEVPHERRLEDTSSERLGALRSEERLLEPEAREAERASDEAEGEEERGERTAKQENPQETSVPAQCQSGEQ